jgi:P-type Cu2+ transporter
MHAQAAPIDIKQAFAVLDDPLEWPRFSRASPSRPGMWESVLQVDGMVCAACAVKVEQALRSLPGVEAADVSAGRRSARVLWSTASTRPSALFGAIAGVGYTPLPANDASAKDVRQRESRLALWRWLVAGLCMMQVMMYAYPAYIAEPGDLAKDQVQVLRWASWVLTLPVMAFSCTPFFKAAWRDAVQRRVGMDTPVALAMVIMFAASTAGTFNPEGAFGAEVYFDSLTMFVFFLLTSRWLELRLRDQTAGALDALVNRLPHSVQRRVGSVGGFGSVGSVGITGDAAAPAWRFEVVSADRLRVGDLIRVLPGEAFPADGLLVEGRTHVDESLLSGESSALARDAGQPLVAGSFNLSGSVLMQVTQVGASTRFAQIVALMQEAALAKPALAALADRIAAPFLWFVLVGAVCAGALVWAQGPQHAVMVAVAVLIVTCPCALSLATPAAMMAASGALARAGVLVRRPQALEALANADTFVFDKTGTLTQDALTVGPIATRAGLAPERAVALAGALASQSVHPASRAIAAAAQAAQGASGDWVATKVQEMQGQGLTGEVDGAGVLRLGSASHCYLTAPAGSPKLLYLSDRHGWLASFELVEKLRQDASQVVTQLAQMGKSVEILSGDSPAAVQRVAKALGIANAAGDCRPEDKLRRLQYLSEQGRQVAMVGDGLNDGPALAFAGVSIAMGRAVPVAQSKADFVVQGDQLGAVVRAVALARKTVWVVRQNLLWALVYNLVCIPLAAMGWLPAWLAGLGMATSSLVVVLNALRLARPLAPTVPERV